MDIRHIAVIGHPIRHSMSPYLQKRLFALKGISVDFHLLDYPDIPSAVPELKGMDGFNVTIPHKTAIIPFLQDMEEKARLCGSVNTVAVRDGLFYGTTTDGAGCRAALKRAGLDFSGKVLLLGNGGAARALLFEAVGEAHEITLVCRENSLSKASEILRDAKNAIAYKRDTKLKLLRYDELEAEENERYDLLINATSVGMYPDVGKTPVSERVVKRCAAVFDAVFNPKETMLIGEAKKSGAKTAYGVDMLVYQAAESHRFWYGGTFSESELAALCADVADEMEKIFSKGLEV